MPLALLKDDRNELATHERGAPFVEQVRAVCGVVFGTPALRLVIAGFMLAHLAFVGLAFTQLWLVKERGMDAAGIATRIGALQLLFGLAGSVVGGMLGDRLLRKFAGGHAGFMVLLVAVCTPLMLAYRFAPVGSMLFYVGMCAGFFLPLALYGPANSMILSMTPSHMRSTVSGFTMLVINVVAIAIGNLAVGAIIDALGKANFATPIDGGPGDDRYPHGLFAAVFLASGGHCERRVRGFRPCAIYLEEYLNVALNTGNNAENNVQNLQGRIALVTGAGRGMGGAIAKALAQAGAQVAICDIDVPALEETRAAIEAGGAACLALPCDISSSEAVNRMFEQIVDRFGTLHILVNNAALVPNRPIDTERRNKHYAYITTPMPRQSLAFTSSMSDEEWLRYWNVNVHGLFYCTRAALKLMEPQRDGKIVNIASTAGMSPMSAHSPHYSATKGAVIAFTKSVAAEVAGANIFVNAMAPGGVATPDFDAYLAAVGEEKRNQMWQMVPAGRLGTMEEYASMVVYLSGQHYLVGQVISPNGGVVI